MKSINMLLIVSLMYQLTYLQARPGGAAGGRSGMSQTNNRINIGRSESNTTQKAFVGNAVMNRNNNEDLAETAVSSIENQTNDQTDSTQTTNQQIAMPIATQQIESIPTEPAAINPPEVIPPTIVSTPIEPTTSYDPQGKVIVPEKIQTTNESQLSTKHTQKAEVADQEKILKTLKAIDQQDSNNKMLLTQSSMDQLFNNFIYFKNFIVENFTKEKMLHLCVEFIDQIYPKETVIGTNILQEKSSYEKSKENDSTQNIQEEPKNNQIEDQSNMITDQFIDNSEDIEVDTEEAYQDDQDQEYN